MEKILNPAPELSDIECPWALVTGASAGIGAEFCRQLASLGYRLVLVARREDRLHALAESLKTEFSAECRVIALDLAEPDAASRLDQSLESAGIEVEFLVNNAGFGLPGHYTQSDWPTHDKFIQLMVTAVCDLCWRLLPGMQRRKKGYIINVASLAGLVPGTAGHTLYSASKAFLVRFSESLALENEVHGVRVSALCPGFTFSEFHDVTGTRDLVSRMPSWMWMQAEPVVAYGIDSVRGKEPRVIAVPGRANRNIWRMMRFLPASVSLAFTRRASRKYRAQTPSH